MLGVVGRRGVGALTVALLLAGAAFGQDPGPAPGGGRAHAQADEVELKGVVVDEAGQPVAGATVEILREVYDETKTTTDAEGRFRRSVPVGTAGTLVASHQFHPVHMHVRFRADPGIKDFRIVLRGGAAGAVRVRVQAAGASAPAGDEIRRRRWGFESAAVLLFRPDSTRYHSGEARDGVWESTGVAAGRWTLRTIPLDWSRRPAEQVVQVAAGGWTEVIASLEEGVALEGTVHHANGQPARDVTVRAAYEWPARSAGGDPLKLVLFAHNQGVVTACGPGGCDSWSTGSNLSADATTVTIETTTGPGGGFQILGLPAGPMTLTVEHEGAEIHRATVEAGAALAPITLPSATAQLVVVLPRADGEQRPVWTVYAIRPDGSVYEKWTRDAQLPIRGLPAGATVVWATATEGNGIEPTHGALAVVHLMDGVPAEVTLESRHVGGLLVRPTRGLGGPPIAAHVELLWQGRRVPTGFLMALPDRPIAVPAGEELTLRLVLEGFEPVERPIRVPPGESMDLGTVVLAPK